MITGLSARMISDYIKSNDNETVLRRTRGATRKLIDTYKIDFQNIKVKKDKQIATYSLNDKKLEIHVKVNDKIIEVICHDCIEFCSHRRILLAHIIKAVEATEVEPPASLKRKRSSTSSKESKRLKFDAENDSGVINSKTPDADKILIVKKKKTIELSPELLDKVEVLKMENLMKTFGRGSFEDFQKHCIKIMNENPSLAEIAHELTVEQADTSIWHELRIGRITASRLHEATRCTMTRGSFVEKLMGQRSGWSFAMMRGTVLEEFVFLEVMKEYPDLRRAGLIMDHKIHPFLAASPDGLHNDFVLEIKCPATQNTYEQYIDINRLSKKYFAQIQLQMYITGKTKAMLAVASLDFEKTRNITKIWIPFDEDYMKDMIDQAMEFYEKAVFPALKRKFLR